MNLSFGPSDHTFVQVYSFTYLVVNILLQPIFFGLLVHRAVQEIKDKFIDLVTISQYALLAIGLVLDTMLSVMLLFNELSGADYMSTIVSTSLFLYYYLNLYIWILMICHIKELNVITQSHNFKSTKKRIYRIEMATSIIPIMSFIILLVVKFFYFHAVWTKGRASPELKSIEVAGIIVDIVLSSVFIIASPIIYYALVKTMKANLYLYYEKQKWRLLWIIMANLLFMVFRVLYAVLSLYNIPVRFISSKGLSIWIQALYITSMVSLSLSHLFLIYFNIKNINFKRYLMEIYKGLEIKNRYEEASIFIKKSRFFKPIDSTIDPDYLQSGSTNSISFDTDTVDTEGRTQEERYSHFSQNYRQIYGKPSSN